MEYLSSIDGLECPKCMSDLVSVIAPLTDDLKSLKCEDCEFTWKFGGNKKRGMEVRGELVRQRIQAGESFEYREGGNSMLPILKSMEPVWLEPITRRLKKGDIVFCKVQGHYYTHLISAVGSDGRYQISNNHGRVNGWTRDVIALATPMRLKRA